MTAPLFITTEKRHTALPLLIVDKPGHVSIGLLSIVAEHYTTVFVSEQKSLPHLSRVSHISFRRKVPSIPDDHFSAIILFYQGEAAIRDGLHSFIKKARQNHAKLVIVTSQEYSGASFLKKALTEYGNAHLLITGDIFGLSPHEQTLATRMVRDAAVHGKIVVAGSGLEMSYPVYYADMLQGILSVLLSQHAPRIGLLYPENPVPQIHLARLVSKRFPQAKMAFAGKETKKPSPVVPEGEVLVEDPYPLEEKLSHLTSFTKDPTPPEKEKKRGRFKTPQRRFVVLGGIAVVVLLLLPLMTFGFFSVGMLNLSVAATAGKTGDLPLAERRATTAKLFFTLAEQSSGGVDVVSTPFGLGEQAAFYHKQVLAGKTAADVAIHLSAAGIAYAPLLSGDGQQSEEAMVTVSSHIKQAILGLGTLRAEEVLPERYRTELMAYEKPLRRLSGVIESVPSLLGTPREKTYLVLFQNNMELRPGGGFIGSYGLLTLRNGRMVSFTVHDVYDADGQLTGHIEPPYALRRHLGVSHLFLRDSNYDLEYAQNAAVAANLLQLSTQEQVDGVIAMDVSFLRLLLKHVGPVYLPVYNQTVNEENFYLLAQGKAENDFFPGSSQKKDFLQHVAKAIILTMQERKDIPLISLLQAVDQAVSQKHLMIAVADGGSMTMLLKNGFAPSVTVSDEEHRAEVSDFLSVSEANLGVNKTNYYIRRSFTHQLSLGGRGERTGTLTVHYKNTSTAASPFGGPYTAYVRLILPSGSTLTRVLLNDVDQVLIPAVISERVYGAEAFIPPEGLEVEELDEYGRRVYGFLVTVPIGETLSVTADYASPAPESLPTQFSYLLRVFKQPGTEFDPYRLTLTYDQSLRLLRNPSYASRTPQSISVTRELSEDILLPMEFSRR